MSDRKMRENPNWRKYRWRSVSQPWTIDSSGSPWEVSAECNSLRSDRKFSHPCTPSPFDRSAFVKHFCIASTMSNRRFVCTSMVAPNSLLRANGTVDSVLATMTQLVSHCNFASSSSSSMCNSSVDKSVAGNCCRRRFPWPRSDGMCMFGLESVKWRACESNKNDERIYPETRHRLIRVQSTQNGVNRLTAVWPMYTHFTHTHTVALPFSFHSVIYEHFLLCFFFFSFHEFLRAPSATVCVFEQQTGVCLFCCLAVFMVLVLHWPRV